MARKEKQAPEPADEAEFQPDTKRQDELETTAAPVEQPPKPAEPATATTSGDEPHPNAFQRLWGWLRIHKKVSIPAALLVLLAALAAIPTSRYTIAGLFIQQSVTVSVVDAQTKKAVSSATVSAAGVSGRTDGNGRTTLKLPPGPQQVTVSKRYYKDAAANVSVPLFEKGTAEVRMTATGRQVPVTITNKITAKPVSGATIQAEGTEAKTDKNGKAVLVLPAGKETVNATLRAPGYNETGAAVKVTADESANVFGLVPAGKIYFLSNADGKIDVVKSNLDGSRRETVLPGTGKEDKFGTVLLASRDWKYLALHSKRDGGDHAKLFLIETESDRVTVMDEGKANFYLAGWWDHHFVYRVERTEYKDWQPKKEALKSYNAASKKIALLDETGAVGDDASKYLREYMGNAYDVNGEIVFTKSVHMYGWLHENLKRTPATAVSVKPDGSAKRVIKSWSAGDGVDITAVSVDSKLYKPNELYMLHTPQYSNKSEIWEYEDGKIKQVDTISRDKFYDQYPTFLQSPSGEQTFWSEPRDGKNALFVGDKAGDNQRQVMPLSEYQTYGWFTQDYLLVSKEGSELYIMPANNKDATTEPLKLTDYYRPAYTYPGYGGGYGGI